MPHQAAVPRRRPHPPRALLALPHLPPPAAGAGRISSLRLLAALPALSRTNCDSPGMGMKDAAQFPPPQPPAPSISSQLGTAGTAGDGRPPPPMASRCEASGSAMSRGEEKPPGAWRAARHRSGNAKTFRQSWEDPALHSQPGRHPRLQPQASHDLERGRPERRWRPHPWGHSRPGWTGW